MGNVAVIAASQFESGDGTCNCPKRKVRCSNINANDLRIEYIDNEDFEHAI